MPVNNIGIPTEEQIKIHQQFEDIFKDEKVDFSARLDNLWKAQMNLTQQHGRDGIMVVLDYETRVYVDAGIKKSLEIMHYSEVPETCPWYHLHLLALDEAICEAWKSFPIEFSTTLKKNCKDLFAVFADGKWFLAYAYQAKDYRNVEYYDFLAGREPEPEAKLSKELNQAGWKMPKDLKAFYNVHGNFGDITAAIRNDDTHCISSAEKLEASLTFLEQYVEKWDVDYSFFDLLPFCEDGAGNSRNFYKVMPENGSYMTVDWDHETKEISGASTLADFIHFQFADKLEGRW